MSAISRFVIWICRKFNRDQIEQIVVELRDVLENRNPEVHPRDQFKEEHPNYRDYQPDPLEALTEDQLPPGKKKLPMENRRTTR